MKTCLLVIGLSGALVWEAAVAGGTVTAQSAQPVRTPSLPQTPYRYTAVDLPAHFDAAQPQDNTPRSNRLTDAGAALGRVLFYDTQLSVNNTTACASCHLPTRAGSAPASTVS
jgi:cytochrome c peroxidase